MEILGFLFFYIIFTQHTSHFIPTRNQIHHTHTRAHLVEGATALRVQILGYTDNTTLNNFNKCTFYLYTLSLKINYY